MSFKDSLVKLFPRLKNFKGTIKILSDNKSSKIVINKGPVTNINIAALRPQDKINLQEALRAGLQTTSPLLIEESSDQLLRAYQATERHNNQLIDFFRGKIPSGDINILRSSLFLKSQLDTRGPTERLKEDIVQKYGERGRNIANLCSAGYYEEYIKPLFEKNVLLSDENSLKKFWDIYEIIVTQFPIAIFVSKNLTSQKLKTEILEKIKLNKKYGIGYLNIHGIGGENVDKISEIISEKEIRKELSSKPEITQGENFIHVKIRFTCPASSEDDSAIRLLDS